MPCDSLNLVITSHTRTCTYEVQILRPNDPLQTLMENIIALHAVLHHWPGNSV